MGEKRHTWVEIEIQDHPSRPEQKIFCFYDVTEIQEFRSQIYDQEKFEGMVGKSKAMADVFGLIRNYSGVASTVMIEGETGTGKEMVARAIYSLSPRKEGPFITVNCAALTDTLLESQLIGHKKGSFTGALQDQKGVFEAADKGTIFLDEIGDLSTAAQTRLLRVLQEHEITRVGETRPRKIDVRVLTATNKDLDEEVTKGNFRLYLLYRIKVGRIYLPPLRERREDIPLLANFFLHQSKDASSKQIEGFTDEAMKCLTQYDWPGNLRELQNAVEFAIIYSREKKISREDLPPEMQDERNIGEGSTSIGDLQQPSRSEEEERERFLAALDQANGNRTKAARLLGIGRTTLYRQLKNHGITD